MTRKDPRSAVPRTVRAKSALVFLTDSFSESITLWSTSTVKMVRTSAVMALSLVMFRPFRPLVEPLPVRVASMLTSNPEVLAQ
jgi:hypothetical protein